MLAVLCSMGLAFTSCQSDNVLTETNQNSVRSRKDTPKEGRKFTLVRDEIIDTETESVELRSSDNEPSLFESSIPIHLYYYHGGEKSDHYFGREAPNRPLIINGRHYLYMYQDFNLVREGTWQARPLYRYYSAAQNDHLLSTEPSIQGYKREAYIGNIYSSIQVGTVPLKEYYSSIKKNHHYVSRNSEVEYIRNNAKDYAFQRIVGYVYPGRVDSQKQADVITARIEKGFPCTITFKLKVKDGDNRYRNLSYSETFGNNNSLTIENESGSITLPSSYTIVSINITVDLLQRGITCTFKNMEKPENPNSWENNWSYPPVSITKREIIDNHITYTFFMRNPEPVGNVPI